MGTDANVRPAILTEAAEASIRAVMTVAAEHDAAVTLQKGLHSIPTAKFGLNGTQPNALAYVMNCIVIVEMFVAERLLTIYDSYAATATHPVFDDMWEVKRKNLSSNWPNMLAGYKVWPKVIIRNLADWPTINGYIAARNSWAHGQGRLTERQLRDPSVLKAIVGAGFELNYGVVHVRSDQVLTVARTCRSFVRALDVMTARHVG